MQGRQIHIQFSSVAQSCPTLCDPMNRSTLGLPVHHQLLESTQTHVHWVSDAIQPPHPLWFRSYLNGLVVFSTFFNFSLNLALRSSWFEAQSAPGLVFAYFCFVQRFSIFGCKKYNQSDFIIDHLVMSIYRVISCVVGKGYLLWPV